ncbi:endonuclease domain-containing protein [Microbacterium sp. MPKO10]|uniref:endonuclease domain-containing protein n=1 Tax=Microbacterium sp. MPKO10 TaxID=2989818 RepID=UPI003558797D
MRQQVRIAGHRVDGLVGERLVLQFDGADHLSREQKQTDARHDNELRLMGYTVLRFTYQDVVEFWPYVEASVQRALAQGAHLAPSTAA